MLSAILCWGTAIAMFIVTKAQADNTLLEKIDKAIDITKNQIATIHKEWQVDSYPNFLKSCFMHRSSWEILKYKYLERLLDAAATKSPKKFVASFSGSSVTAGHDSNFNLSTSEVLGRFMKDSFAAMDITFESRNVALGNNPCVPYDVCIKYFAGFDADIVHWEQNYFCDGRAVMETFIRQAMTIPTRPVVVFSESNTGHWQQDKCKVSHTMTEAEKKLLAMSHKDLVSEGNKDEYHRAWGFVAGVSKLYHGAGIQTFQHEKHTDYACLGPYIKTWMEGAASWHPSVIAHRLRAAHHAYFWLLIYVDALEEMKKVVTHRSVDAALKDARHHAETLYHPMAPTPKHTTPFADNMTCHTDYQPRAIQSSSLKDIVLSGLASEEPLTEYAKATPGSWHFIIYENIVDKNLVLRSKKMGYIDYKFLMFSGENAGPLSLKLNIAKPGPVFICQTPGIWGSLPKGFSEMWSADLEVYVTYNVENASKGYEFEKEKATKNTMVYDKHGLELCVQLKTANGGKGEYPAGNHVLTLIPSAKHRVIFAWMMHT